MLIVNPRQPFVTYELERRSSLKTAKAILERSHDCLRDLSKTQHKKAFDERQKESFMTKVRNCSLTAAEMDAKFGKGPLFSNIGLGRVFGNSTGQAPSSSGAARAGDMSPARGASSSGVVNSSVSPLAKKSPFVDADDLNSVAGSVVGRQLVARAGKVSKLADRGSTCDVLSVTSKSTAGAPESIEAARFC